MDGELHSAMQKVNWASSSLIDADFWQRHGMNALTPLERARDWLKAASAHLDAYEETLRLNRKDAA